MKKLMLTATAAAAALTFAGAAQAQGWMSIGARQEVLDDRIDAGVRSGDLTRAEALQLRDDYRVLLNLEARYRVNGLSAWERSDLDRRYDALETRVEVAVNDDDDRYNRYADADEAWDGFDEYASLEQRKMQLDRRIERGLENGRLTGMEAARLRADFDAIARIEARYRVNGLSNWERADLNRRFDVLADRIRWERTDRNRQYGYRD